jgi:3-phosphoshikimate 1-carboxyvinyltransferase
MKISILKSKAKGRLEAPPSKSYTIRGLMCAGMAKGASELVNPLASEDTITAFEALQNMGVEVKRDAGQWLISSGGLKPPEGDLFCNESAATMRFLIAICSLLPGKSRLVAAPSLAKRPMKPLLEALARAGLKHSMGPGSAIIIHGGDIKRGEMELPGDVSSQYVSALLLAAPLARRDIRIKLSSPPRSKPYIMMTVKCMESFGVNVGFSLDFIEYRVQAAEYKPCSYIVEGDWSSASYLLALGAVAGETIVKNLNMNSLQGDREIINILSKMGANLSYDSDAVTVKAAPLKAINTDLSDCIDLLPTVSVLATLAVGTSELRGISAARFKESDRVHAIKGELRKTGIKVKEKKDSLVITGGYPRNALIDPHNDHRIAMAMSILGASRGIEIDGAECVSKTFPGYWEALKSAGVEIKEDEQ